ncbi:hypothetical protein D3C71_1337630 [compost metagenome]
MPTAIAPEPVAVAVLPIAIVSVSLARLLRPSAMLLVPVAWAFSPQASAVATAVGSTRKFGSDSHTAADAVVASKLDRSTAATHL